MTKIGQTNQAMLDSIGVADRMQQPMVLQRWHGLPNEETVPMHQHKKGQLIVPLRGSVTTFAENGIWSVPPLCAVWIPGSVPHSNTVAAHTDVCMIFIDVEQTELPSHVCTISISPLIRELVLHIVEQPVDYETNSTTYREVQVLLNLLNQAPTEAFAFPIPDEPRLKALATMLLKNPQDRFTLKEWAHTLAMSERSLSRLVKQHTKLSFGQWRAQLKIVITLQKLANNEPIQSISESLGYESISAFITFFKQQFGCSPRQYRQQRWGD